MVWPLLVTGAVAGLSAIGGAVFGSGSKKEETINESYQYTEANQYTYTSTYSPQYTITYNPIVTIESPNTKVYPQISQDTSLTPSQSTTLTSNTRPEITSEGSQTSGIDLKPLMFGAMVLGLAYIFKR